MGKSGKVKADKSVQNSTTHKKNPIASGSGGGYDLPALRYATSDSNKGHGTYRGDQSIAVNGQDLPLYKLNNPHGSGAKLDVMEPRTSTTGLDGTKKLKFNP
ncbi:hypothetical protein PG988_011456 [Apiospora saccharicola]